MSDTQAATPQTKTISIGTKEKKLQFSFPVRYFEGHAINANEARSLNQTMAENLGNNFRATVQEYLNGNKNNLSEDDLRAKFSAYADSYVFSAPSAGGARSVLTPLEKECLVIARQVVSAQLAKTNRKVESKKHPADGQTYISREVFDSEVARIAETDKVQKIAKRRLREMETAGEE